MNKKKLQIPLYAGSVTIIQTNNFKKVEKKYDLTSLLGVDALVFRKPNKNGASRYILVFENKTSPYIISHECLHFVNYVFDDSHISLDAVNDEPQCYLLGWIVGKCHKFLKIK